MTEFYDSAGYSETNSQQYKIFFVLLFFLQVVGEAGERRRPSVAWAESGPGPEAEIAFQPISTKQMGR